MNKKLLLVWQFIISFLNLGMFWFAISNYNFNKIKYPSFFLLLALFIIIFTISLFLKGKFYNKKSRIPFNLANYVNLIVLSSSLILVTIKILIDSWIRCYEDSRVIVVSIMVFVVIECSLAVIVYIYKAIKESLSFLSKPDAKNSVFSLVVQGVLVFLIINFVIYWPV